MMIKEFEIKDNTLKTICVLTPAFNREEKLSELYGSLKNQTVKDFVWMIVDDGSEDGTETQVRGWVDQERDFVIQYYRKENGGKHTALNLGFEKISEPLTFIVDSDDLLTKDAIEKIILNYKIIKDNNSVCGIVFLRGTRDGKCIGDRFNREEIVNWNHMRYVDEIQGDKAEVWVTEKLNKFRFPVFKNEKFIGEHYIWCQLAEQYDIYAVNEIIYRCDYLEGGLTKSGRTLRIKCPYGGMENSKVLLKKCYPLKYRVKNAILYDCYGFFSDKKQLDFIKNSGYSILTIVTLLPGFLLYVYWGRRYGE